MNPLFRSIFPSSNAEGPSTVAPRPPDTRRAAVAAREAMRKGHIPSRLADQLWGGPGSGGGCAICNETLRPHQVEYELEFSHGVGAGTYHVHVACCMAWETELS